MMTVNSKFLIRSWLGRSGIGYDLISRFLSARKTGILLNDHTDLCIEGYPRSANTFAVLAFQSAQPIDYQISHHTHLAGHVVRAVQKGIPTIVLIREPLDAACSLHIREPKLSPGSCLQLFIDFYEPLIKYSGHFILAPFHVVTSDFGRIIRAVNERFATDYAIYQNSEERDKQVMDKIRASPTMNELSTRISLPTEERRKIKKEKLQIFRHSTDARLLDIANDLYRAFLYDADY